MNVTESEAQKKICPVMSAGEVGILCQGSSCMYWRWTEPMIDGPDSYVSEPGPTGFCGGGGRADIN